MITNALGANKFAIISGADATTDPTIGTNGAVTSGNVRVAIDNSGNVGIKTDSPTHPLHVAGDIRINNGSALKLYNAAGNGWAEFRYNNTLDHVETQRSFQSATDGYYNLGSSGKKWGTVFTGKVLGNIGTNGAPTYSFDGYTDTGMYMFQSGSPATDHIAFSTDGSRRVYISSAGLLSDANLYTSTTGQFRNYGGTWKATTGISGNGFEFVNTADSSTALTLTAAGEATFGGHINLCLLYTSPSPRDLSTSRMPSSA